MDNFTRSLMFNRYFTADNIIHHWTTSLQQQNQIQGYQLKRWMLPEISQLDGGKYTLKQISNWPLYKIWYYATYFINASKVWFICIVHTNLSITGKKKKFPCTKLSMRNGRCENRLWVGAPRARQGSCRIW